MTGSRPESEGDPSDADRRLAELSLIGMVLIWGVNFAVVKVVLTAVSPLAFNAVRHVIASIFMLGVLLLRGGVGRPVREDVPRIIYLGILGVVAYQMAFVFGLDRTRAGNAALMLALVPVFLLIFERRSSTNSRAAWGGVALSVLGVALVSGSTIGLEGTETLVGDLLMIGAAAVWASYTYRAGPLIERYGPIRTTAWTLWVGALGLLLAGLPSVAKQPWSQLGAGVVAAILFSSIFAIGVAYLFWYRGVQVLGGTRTAVFSNLTPVVALLTGAFFLGERLTVFSVVGAACVLAGVMLVRRARI